MIEIETKKVDANHELRPGAILVSSWGYEQTNVVFYVVTRITRTMACIQRIESVEEFGSGVGSMTGTSRPADPIDYWEYEHVLRRKVGENNRISIKDHKSAIPWDGQPKRFSTYA